MSKIIAILCLGLLMESCHKDAEPPDAAIPTVRVANVELISPDTAEAERYSASITPIEQIDLGFKSAGIVDHILTVRGADGRMRDVQIGDKVTRGSELGAVRALDYEQRLQQAQAQVGQADAQLAQAKAQLTQAQANFSEASVEYTRAKTLFESASLVKLQYDQAKGRYDTTQAAVEAARAAVDNANAAVANARAVANQAKLSLSDTTIRAPFTGWITARNVQKGSLASSTTPAFSMMDSHLVKAVFSIPDFSLKNVRAGQQQAVMLDAVQHPLQGIVTAISPQADPKGRVFMVEVTIANPSEDVRPGMIGTLFFGGAKENMGQRLVVPLAAVVKAPNQPQAFAVFRVRNREGKSFAESQEIQIGNTYGNAIEVITGLKAGDRIVALGGSLLRDGQEIRLLP